MFARLQRLRKQKIQQQNPPPALPALPSAIWRDHIYGFLFGDRESFLAISLLNKEIREAMRDVPVPWPTDLVLRPPGGDQIVSGMFSRDGKKLVCLTSKPKRIYVWNRHGLEATIEQEGGIRYTKFSPNGKEMLTIGDRLDHKSSREIRIWDTSNWRCLRTLKCDSEHVLQSVIYSPAGDVIAAIPNSHENQKVILWYTTKPIHQKENMQILDFGRTCITNYGFLSGGNYLMVHTISFIDDVDDGFRVRIFEKTSEGYLERPTLRVHPCLLPDYSRGNRHVVYCGDEYQLYQKDPISLILSPPKRVSKPLGSTHLKFSPDGRFLVAMLDPIDHHNIVRRSRRSKRIWRWLPWTRTVDSGTMQICDVEEGNSVSVLKFQPVVYQKTPKHMQFKWLGFDFSPDGKYMFVIDDKLGAKIIHSSWLLR